LHRNAFNPPSEEEEYLESGFEEEENNSNARNKNATLKNLN
jgi:hypothetical protein